MHSSRFVAFFAISLSILFSAQSSFANCLSIVIPTPNDNIFNVLSGASGTSLSDVWAVGYSAGYFPYQQNLIEHFNGSAWSIVPGPKGRRHTGSMLTSVSASSPTDAWAVGFYNNADEYPRALALHWDGATWKQVETHTFGLCYFWRYFNGVSVNPTNARDVWAVGWSMHECSYPTQLGIAEHWNGTSWSLIKLWFSETSLNAVATTTQGAWAVGSIGGHPYIVHLSGSIATRWRAAHKCCTLTGVSALSPNEVWAVGSDNSVPIIEHFDGTAWSSVSNPSIPGALTSVHAVSPTDVWAVGAQTSVRGYRALVEHWDGSSWSVVPSASAAERILSELSGVFAATDRAIAVGSFTKGGLRTQTLGSLATCATHSTR